mmetsp:Transcript_28115/g.66053  ORF Transcript_28115/g.66053 Transcript_28115/m.66053 type:complete len:288 (+) Transcript_28115:48-911(+)
MSGIYRPGQVRRPLTSAVLRPCSPLLSDSASNCLQRARSQPLALGATTGSFDFRRVQEPLVLPSPKRGPGLLSPPLSRPKSRNSPTAGVLQENSRAESCAAELERALRNGAHGAPSERDDAQLTEFERPSDLAEVISLRDKFHQDVASMTSKLEYLAKHSRLEHLSESSKKDKEAERAKLEERRIELERRARQRERMSHDPRKNVAIKVENRRKFGWESWNPIAESIPICEVDAGWKSGKKVGLVDVATLTAQCKQLRRGAVSLNDLLAKPRQTNSHGSNVAWPSSR